MQENYKEKILSFYENRGRMPTYTEIMILLGFKSKNAVYKLINKLVDAGVINKDKDGRLIPIKLNQEIKFLGLVEAGIPSVVEEEETDTLNLDEYLVKNRSRSFILEVKGDSMIEAGIQEGDLVVVERCNEARDGEIVIAEVDGGWTMKYLRKKGNRHYLEPANRKYKPIYPLERMNIGAVVRGIIRKY